VSSTEAAYDPVTRGIHLLLVLFGLAAIASGDFAGDYRRAVHPGFDFHSIAGLGMAAALGMRLVWGLVGPRSIRFSTWLPVTASRLAPALEDLRGLLSLKLPSRENHEGLAGVVQALGLLAFAWMAISGAVLFAYLEPGARASGWLRAVKELHEAGQGAVIAYLVVHAGAVLVHALLGTPGWQRMFSLRGTRR
jgi:cytochrome b561